MSNFKTLLNHEFQNQLKSFKFLLVIIITLLVTLFCVFIQVQDFAERKAQYDHQIERKHEMINSARVFSEFKIPIIIKPNPLSIFAKGYDEKLGNEIIISWKNLPEFSRFDFFNEAKENVGSNEKNSFLNIFANFDVISIVTIILSILVIFVVADAISRERESQTLQLVYTNPVKRFQFFTAKYIGNLAVLSIPLIVIFVSSTLMIILQPFIEVGDNFYFRVLMIFLGCFLFLSVFTLITLSISSVSSSSSKSLIYGLLLWMLLVFVYPNSIQYIVEKSVSIPSLMQLEKKKENFYKDYRKKLNRSFKSWFPVPIRFANTEDKPKVIPKIIGVTEKHAYVAHAENIKKLLPQFFDFQKEMMRSIDRYRDKLIQRQRIIDRVSFFIPNQLLKHTGTKLANTNRYARDIYIRQQAQKFRSEVLDYMRSKDGLYGYKFFTQMKPEDMKEDIRKYSQSMINQYTRQNYPSLDLKDIPQFSYKSLFQFPIEMSYLVIVNLVLFVLGIYLFNKSELL